MQVLQVGQIASIAIMTVYNFVILQFCDFAIASVCNNVILHVCHFASMSVCLPTSLSVCNYVSFCNTVFDVVREDCFHTTYEVSLFGALSF